MEMVIFMYMLLGIFAILIVIQTIVGRAEKRMVWPYGTPTVAPQFPDETGYGMQSVLAAGHLGFILLGWAPDMKGPKYRMTYALMVSPARDSFIVIGIGSIFGMNLRGTWIHTPSVDGRSFCTTDNQSCVEVDPSRSWFSQLRPGRPFPELWKAHQEWTALQRVSPVSFSPSREMDEFRQIRENHFAALAGKRFLAYTDAQRTHWRYTLFGAFILAIMSYTIGLVRAVTGGRLPRTA